MHHDEFNPRLKISHPFAHMWLAYTALNHLTCASGIILCIQIMVWIFCSWRCLCAKNSRPPQENFGMGMGIRAHLAAHGKEVLKKEDSFFVQFFCRVVENENSDID